MIHRISVCLGYLLTLGVSGRPAVAQVPSNSSDAAGALTWQDVYRRVATHPSITAAGQSADAARLGVDAVGVIDNPSLSGQAAYGKSREGNDARVEWGLSLSMPFGWLGTRAGDKAIARAEAAEVEAEVLALRRRLLLGASERFWRLAEAEARVGAISALDEETAKLEATVAARVDKGDARPVEGMRIAVASAKVKGELLRAEGALETARESLALWIGVENVASLRIAADLTRLPTVVTKQEATQRILAVHPALLAEKARIEVRAGEVTAAEKARRPDVEVEIFTEQELDKSSYGGGIGVELPLWQREQGRIRYAKARLVAKKGAQAGVLRLVQEEALAAYEACSVGVEVASHYRDTVLPKAAAAAKVVARTFELGEAPLIDVIDARRTLIETRTEYLDTLGAAQRDCGHLTVLMGER